MRTSTLSKLLTLAACACLLVPAASLAATMSTPAPPPTAGPPLTDAEKLFVNSVTSDLQRRFPTTAEAAAAGYFRYTDEDNTGAISWVNTAYWTSEPQRPSQLWFDVSGKLIGADFSVLQADSASAPSKWGISPARWITLRAHVHYGIKSSSGMTFGGYGPKTAGQYGVTLTSPTPADVVRVRAAKHADQVAFVFPFPAIWDLQVWLVPNPLGAFAEHNPNVVPSANARMSM